VNHRPLKKIAAEIATILKRQAKDVIEIGRLLTEAREQLDEHAQWLLWLTDNFSLSIRTAQRYLTAHAFASKYDTVSHLSLTVSGLYALIEADRAGRSEAVEAALSEAKVQWVDDDRVREIVAALRPPPPEEPPSDEASDEAPPPDAAKDGAQPPDEASDEQSLPIAEGGDEEPEPALEPDDDRPPPAPPPSLTPRQAAQLSKFEIATKELQGLSARSAREFLAASMSDFDLETLADFLQQVVREREKLRAAASDQGGSDVALAARKG
jgi:hypothetical protein